MIHRYIGKYGWSTVTKQFSASIDMTKMTWRTMMMSVPPSKHNYYFMLAPSM